MFCLVLVRYWYNPLIFRKQFLCAHSHYHIMLPWLATDEESLPCFVYMVGGYQYGLPNLSGKSRCSVLHIVSDHFHTWLRCDPESQLVSISVLEGYWYGHPVLSGNSRCSAVHTMISHNQNSSDLLSNVYYKTSGGFL